MSYDPPGDRMRRRPCGHEEHPPCDCPRYDPSIEQPAPVRTDGQDIQSLVMADIAARREVGIQRYGTPLQTNNGRDALRDAYDEVLDLACYLRQEIEERAERWRS
jgi:hypothetical protein